MLRAAWRKSAVGGIRLGVSVLAAGPARIPLYSDRGRLCTHTAKKLRLADRTPATAPSRGSRAARPIGPQLLSPRTGRVERHDDITPSGPAGPSLRAAGIATVANSATGGSRFCLGSVWKRMGHHPQRERPSELARFIEAACACGRPSGRDAATGSQPRSTRVLAVRFTPHPLAAGVGELPPVA